METEEFCETLTTFADDVAAQLRRLLEGRPSPDVWKITVGPQDHYVFAEGRTSEGIQVELIVYCPKRIPPNLGTVQIYRDFAAGRVSTVRAMVLAVPSFTPNLAEQCRALGWNWFDLEGNCRIHVPKILNIEN
jgi:hypothetical protein